MSNRLADQTSPYLRQHADNPVDWYPWGPEALGKARNEDRPILVSIGYSACHWCHVMAHESFEDPATAALMNEHFVNIKVDREEHPDVDAIYMEAIQALTGQGGWPLNVFLTPDQRPFFGGTYFPPEPRHGMRSWNQILEHVSRAYREQRADVGQNAEVLTDYIRRSQLPAGSEGLSSDALQEAFQSLSSQIDSVHGGLRGAPKFPQPLTLDFLLRMHRRYADPEALSSVLFALQKMAEGGIYDQLGGGFHRYSVDALWLVPHFEKMLYDNALLALVYLHAWQITKDARFRTIVEETLDYVLRDMRSSEGGFYSAEDADSEGVEGKFYVWTPADLEAALGADTARITALRFGVEGGGNFEGSTILTVARSLEDIAGQTGQSVSDLNATLEAARRTLLQARSQRVPPGKDTKILAGWNALAIRALAESAAALDRPDYLKAAGAAADFVLMQMRPGGMLVRSYREGPSSIHAFLEDYAYLVEALLSLYESSAEARHYEAALELADRMVELFRDAASGLFYDTDGSEELLVRPRSLYDNPIPSGNSSAAAALLALTAFTGDSRWEEFAAGILQSAGQMLARAPAAFGYLLSALDFYLSTPQQIALIGPPSEARRDLEREIFTRYLPNTVVAIGAEDSSNIPLLADRATLDGRPTAYVCEHFACRLPVNTPAALAEQLT